MARIYDMRQKEVINVRDGCRFGFVCDAEFDNENGQIRKLIVPGPGKIFGVFGSEQEYHIPWKDVCKIGDDIILVDVDTGKALRDWE
ncbi:MAG: YlmC/YmxH family sporulation protein [Defluviitaleaceae bacterium]|nr:YlmC/YmxH family sporulation protein [Defluviitaleaceae bacterium]